MKARAFFASKQFNYIFSVLAILAMWAVWLIAYAVVGNDYIVPSFADTMRRLGELLTESFFWRSFGMTLARAVEGWLLAFGCAVVGIAVGALSEKFRFFLGPFVAVVRVIPTLAVTLMLLLWSSANTVPVIVTFMMLFPVSYAQLGAAYRAVDVQLLEMADVYGLSRTDRIFRIAVPQMLPALFSQAGPNLSLAIKVAVSAEVLARTYISMGGILADANGTLEIARMFAVTLVLLISGGLIEFALGHLTRITDRWTHGRGKEGV